VTACPPFLAARTPLGGYGLSVPGITYGRARPFVRISGRATVCCVTPGRVGTNNFVLHATQYGTGAPILAQSAELQFSLAVQPELGSQTLVLERKAEGLWRGSSSNLGIAGRWTVDVLVQGATNGVVVPLTIDVRAP
jgi:hypothetical protein